MEQTAEKTGLRTSIKKSKKRISFLRPITTRSKQSTLPEIVEPLNGFNVQLYIEDQDGGKLGTDNNLVYFWPGIFQYYKGVRPVEKVLFSKLSYHTPGALLQYMGNTMTEGASFEYDEKVLVSEDYFCKSERPNLDGLFRLCIDPALYNGEKKLFSMNVQIEDFLGDLSNEVAVNFFRCD
ncbi:hypothetical protein GWK08_12340 [Leptobacterium flavescens]|uniref:Uncharacterized protein n=1 Tax=Leptobacterium flavescens TaxID=472055 RepID=A0A6P0ULX2_9FLAO|nr:hypothetical protein [Leptobacterium flavescens]NER14234.1 hypothetical protein [Leptobacterium flavescens]